MIDHTLSEIDHAGRIEPLLGKHVSDRWIVVDIATIGQMPFVIEAR